MNLNSSILKGAIKWSLGRYFRQEQILTEEFIKRVHRQMYGEVWRWAGQFRKSNKNIGVPWTQIGTGLKYVLDDCKYWIANKSFSPDEIAVRLKHRIVQVHCFPNGNGRHSRLMGDIVVTHVFKSSPFSWGGNNLVKMSDARSNYISAIKIADRGNIAPLLAFSRT